MFYLYNVITGGNVTRIAPFFSEYFQKHAFYNDMKLNQIIISGDTNQDFRTPEENESFFQLGKSIQLFFRKKLTRELDTLISRIYAELDRKGLYAKDALIKRFEDHGVRYRKIDREPTEEEIQERQRERDLEVKALLSHDHKTYFDLYEYTLPKIAYQIIMEGGDKYIAKDIFQTALIVLLERIRSEDFMLTCSPGTYLHSVSMNIWRNLSKKVAQRAIYVDLSDLIYEFQETVYFEEIPEEYGKVSAILEQMGDPCRSLLENFYFNQLSWDAIAEKMGYANAASARNQKYKCLEKIREIMSA